MESKTSPRFTAPVLAILSHNQNLYVTLSILAISKLAKGNEKVVPPLEASGQCFMEKES